MIESYRIPGSQTTKKIAVQNQIFFFLATVVVLFSQRERGAICFFLHRNRVPSLLQFSFHLHCIEDNQVRMDICRTLE